MAAIYSNGGNRWNILGFNFTKEMRYLVEVCKSDPNPIRSDFGTKIFISDRIDKVVS
jgi:hypothetical protein